MLADVSVKVALLKMEPTVQDITKLRQRLLNEIGNNDAGFHPKDLQRLNTDNDWLRRFLTHSCVGMDFEKAVQMILKSLAWRRDFKVHDITEKSIEHLLRQETMFPYTKDRQGRRLFMIRAAMVDKSTYTQEDARKCLVYWFEKLEREHGEVTVFFDVMGASAGQMDLEFVKYVIQVLKDYYPTFVYEIIVFELPWVLNAAMKLIKMWIPSKAAHVLKLVKLPQLDDYVDQDQQLTEWGGTCTYRYKYNPTAPN